MPRDAGRIAVRAQLLDRRRPAALLDVVRHLTVLQIEPTAAVAPSADLVVWSRLGSSYAPAELATALEKGTLLEHRGMIRPQEDLALYRAGMAAWWTRDGLRDWQEDQRDWVRANDDCRREILDRLEDDGPLPLSALPDTCEIPWRSSGWNDDRNVSMLLGLMVASGEVAIASRRGRDRLWDLAERVYPDEVVAEDEATSPAGSTLTWTWTWHAEQVDTTWSAGTGSCASVCVLRAGRNPDLTLRYGGVPRLRAS